MTDPKFTPMTDEDHRQLLEWALKIDRPNPWRFVAVAGVGLAVLAFIIAVVG